jgi:rSAM/selenodomain-associated transferase 2
MIPRFAVLIPTLNEAERIGATLVAARHACGDAAEYIVSDGGSTDATVEIAQAADAMVLRGPRGRGAQLNAALQAARAETCILLHADTLLPFDAAQHMSAALEHHVGGAFMLRFAEPQFDWLARAINLRSRIFHSATGDQAMFARRIVLNQIGGVPDVELFEDVRLWRQLKRAGRIQLLQAEVTTSARLWQTLGTWRGMLLHARLRMLHALGVTPQRLARMYPTSGS